MCTMGIVYRFLGIKLPKLKARIKFQSSVHKVMYMPYSGQTLVIITKQMTNQFFYNVPGQAQDDTTL